MIAALAFYQLLATASFTLLGLWFVVVGLSHGSWRTDPVRHSPTPNARHHPFPPSPPRTASRTASEE